MKKDRARPDGKDRQHKHKANYKLLINLDGYKCLLCAGVEL